MNMIRSSKFNIVWNRGSLLEIIPSGGIRQGDPLSPYIFILCLEHLSIMFEEATRNRKIVPFTFRGQIHILHFFFFFFFLDDIFLFTRASFDLLNVVVVLRIS